jgi:hypothetical protein
VKPSWSPARKPPTIATTAVTPPLKWCVSGLVGLRRGRGAGAAVQRRVGQQDAAVAVVVLDRVAVILGVRVELKHGEVGRRLPDPQHVVGEQYRLRLRRVEAG